MINMLEKEKKKTKKEINYQVFFHIGFIWIPVGVVFMITVNVAFGIALIGLGLLYVAIGLANKDKWKSKKN